MKSITNYINESLESINESVQIWIQPVNKEPIEFSVDFKTYQHLLRLSNKSGHTFTEKFSVRKSDINETLPLSDINYLENTLNSFGRSLNELTK